MNWRRSVDSNKDELLPMLAALFAMLGAGETILRHVHLAALALLRPAEAIARRLITIAALDVRLGARAGRAAPTVPIPKGEGVKRSPVFKLFDPRRSVDPAAKHPPGSGPGIRPLDGSGAPVPGRREPLPDDPVAATALRRRAEALRAAVNDIPAQARRLARIEAASNRPVRVMRPGRPPGYNARGRRPIDLLLVECHRLALMAFAERERVPPDIA